MLKSEDLNKARSMLKCSNRQVCKIMFRHREIVGSCWLLCEDAHLVDVIGDELAPPDVEYFDRLSCSSQGRALTNLVARRTVTVDHVPSRF